MDIFIHWVMQSKLSDYASTLVNIFLAIIAFYSARLAIRKFLTERDLKQHDQYRETVKPFLELQLKSYVESCRIAAEIPTKLGDPAELNPLLDSFWKMYWGPLSLVEDRPVEAAMVRYGRHLEEHKNEITTVNHPDIPNIRQILEHASLDIAHCARDSIESSWRITLPKLEKRGNKTK